MLSSQNTEQDAAHLLALLIGDARLAREANIQIGCGGECVGRGDDDSAAAKEMVEGTAPGFNLKWN